jgi:hypothetical protein
MNQTLKQDIVLTLRKQLPGLQIVFGCGVSGVVGMQPPKEKEGGEREEDGEVSGKTRCFVLLYWNALD